MTSTATGTPIAPPGMPAAHPPLRTDYGAHRVSAITGEGDRGGVPLVFVHGMIERWDVWDGLLRSESLADCSRVALDLPWSGSQGPYWPMAASAETWLDRGMQLAPPEPKVLVAHSFGALASLRWLQDHHDEVAGVVFVSPFYKPAFDQFTWNNARYYFNYFDEFIRQSVLLASGERSVRHELFPAITQKLMDQFTPYGWLQFYDLFSRTPGMDLSVLTCPTLVVAGECDISTPVADCRALADALPDSELVVMRDTGHFCMQEQPEALCGEIERFLARVATRNAVLGGNDGTEVTDSI